MKLSVKQLELLVPSGVLDDGYFSQFQKSAQGGVLDTDALPEAYRPIALEVAESDPQVAATADEIEQAAHDAGRKAEEQTGLERCRFWVQEGLIDDQHNLDAVKQHIETHFNGRLSAAAVDHSISSMRDTLHWKPAAPAPKPVPPAPPTPPPPAPVDDLPPVPAFMMKNNQLRTKADVGKLGVKYVEYFRGPHGSAFKKRVDEILRRGI